MKDPMRSYSVTVTMTPRQAIEAGYLLLRVAAERGSAHAYGAGRRINIALGDAGWECVNRGTEDDPIWVWEKAA